MTRLRIPLLMLAVLAAAPAWASSLDFELFDPAPVPQHGVMTESPRPVSDTFTAGAYWQIQDSPVVEYRNGEPVGDIVFYRWQQRLLFSWVPLQFLQISADLPVTLLSDLRVEGSMRAASVYFNDLVFKAKALAWESTDKWGNRWTLGGGASLSLPTGNERLFGGSKARFLQPTVRALAELERGPWFARANLGYAEKDDTYIKSYGLVIKDRVQYRLGGGLHEPRTKASYVLELNGHAQVGDVLVAGQGQALELYAGAQVGVGPVQLIPGAAVGLTQAFGVPSWRLFLGAFYGFSLPPPPVEAEPVAPPTDTPILILVLDTAGEPVSAATVRVARRLPTQEADFAAANSAPATAAVTAPTEAAPVVTEAPEVGGMLVPRPIATTLATAAAESITAPADVTSPQSVVADLNTELTAAASASAATTSASVLTAADGRWGTVLPFGEYDLSVEKDGYVAVHEELVLGSPAPVSRTVVLDIYVPPPPGRYHFTVRDASSSQNVTTATAILRADASTEPVSVPGGILELAWPASTVWKRVRFNAPGYRSAVFEFGRPPTVGTTQWVYVELVPEAGEERVVVTRTEIVIRDRVNFQSGSDRLTKDSLPILDSIAAVLVERPDVQKVIISGHTDNAGRPAANLKLSLRRAEAVRLHLIKKGVAAERLEAIGYGEERPIADNTTAAGKAENRRVELRIDKRMEDLDVPAATDGVRGAVAPVTAPR